MFGFSLVSIDAGKLEGPIVLGMAGIAGYVLWKLHTKQQAPAFSTDATSTNNATGALATEAADISLLQSVGLLTSGTQQAASTGSNTNSLPAVYTTPATVPSATNTVSVGSSTSKGGTV